MFFQKNKSFPHRPVQWFVNLSVKGHSGEQKKVALDFEISFIFLLLVPVRTQHGPPDTETDKSVMTKEIILVKTNCSHLSLCQIHYCSKDLL